MCVFVTIIRRSLWMNNENKKCLLNAKSIRTKQKLKHRRSFGDPSRPTSQIRLAPLSKLLGFDFRFRRCLLSIFLFVVVLSEAKSLTRSVAAHKTRFEAVTGAALFRDSLCADKSLFLKLCFDFFRSREVKQMLFAHSPSVSNDLMVFERFFRFNNRCLFDLPNVKSQQI